MFTGLITAIGTVTTATPQAGGVRLTIECPYTDIQLGESIACNGACLTVVGINEDVIPPHGGIRTPQSTFAEASVDRQVRGDSFTVELSSETISKTESSYWQQGATLNLERALKVGDRLGGHFVTGHVDGLATLESITPVGECFDLTFSVPAELAQFIAPKGSVTLNGVSLTVNQVHGAQFTSMIIPHTWTHTTFHTLNIGAKLHLEIDILARYIARMKE